MNTVRKINASDIVHEIKENKSNLSLVSSKSHDNKNESEKMTKEYLNEKLYYFYTHGGPIMEI